MANTTTINWPVITITLDGSTDWSCEATGDSSGSTTKLIDYAITGLKVDSIRFHPSGANDVMIINEASISGSEIFRVKCSGDTDDRVQYYYGAWLHPYIDASDCTLSSASAARVSIHVV